MSFSTRLGLVAVAVAAVVAASGCTAYRTGGDHSQDPNEQASEDPAGESPSSSAAVAPAFAVPTSCDAIDFKSIVHQMVPDNAGPKLSSGDGADELECNVVAEDAAPGYTVWVTISPSDCANPVASLDTAHKDPGCLDVNGDDCESSDGSAQYNGLSCLDPDGTVLSYQLPSVKVVVNMGEAKDRDYFEKWASAVAKAADRADG
jgi:hypothetical protein